ncbi:MAG: Vitamin K epoxide reductase [Parcubacteria group bacterium GW2011_GWC1_45_9]|nr:MAG: Vitamin K epoxide reductase [Parcubacteria group bacterium GW2011_GWA1_Parcubacteria_45_10]KKT89293.1 MAG: Vitamin K epoxide reductase [Parcubacteria group bacterium GW2011_GWB1_45_10]KKU17209.1 MAG: Vitamin K epoxide reductase [Parcubacteria group bacterium GW2011_GWC1_45_9]HCI05503.1 hypothetical protein [Patescibacteria group bacterium]
MTSKKQAFLGLTVIFGSLIGFLDSAYLAVFSSGKTGVACDVSGFNCDAVLTSVYSRFLGLPLSWWGLAFYISLFFLAMAYFFLKKEMIFRLIGVWLWSGLAVSLILLYLQAFVLKAFCIYCLISETAVFLMAAGYLAVKFLIKDKNQDVHH